MVDKSKYISVGDLRKFFEGLSDDIPVMSAPLNKDIITNFGVGINENGKIGEEYTGKIVVLEVLLFDANSGRRILLVPDNGEPDPIRVKYNFNTNPNLGNMFLSGLTNSMPQKEIVDNDNVVGDEQGND